MVLGEARLVEVRKPQRTGIVWYKEMKISILQSPGIELEGTAGLKSMLRDLVKDLEKESPQARGGTQE